MTPDQRRREQEQRTSNQRLEAEQRAREKAHTDWMNKRIKKSTEEMYGRINKPSFARSWWIKEPNGAVEPEKQEFNWGKANTVSALAGLFVSLYYFLVVSPSKLTEAIGLSLFGALLAGYFSNATLLLIALYCGYKILLFFHG